MKNTKQATILYENTNFYLDGLFESWLNKWKDKITIVYENLGCGCHLNLYDVEGPEEAISEIPPSILARKFSDKDSST